MFKGAKVQSLPGHVLGEIFGYYAWNKQSRAITISYALIMDKSPACISHVCSRWRNLILDAPVFWNHIRILLVEPAHSVDNLNTVLQRSKNYPLDITFDCRPRGWTSQEGILERIEAITNIIVSQNFRLRTFFVKADSIEQLSPVIPRLKYACAPVLESFRLHLIKTDAVCGQLFLGGSPALRSVSFGGIHRSWYAVIMHGLSTLNLDFGHRPCIISNSELWSVFESSPRLRMLDLYGVHIVLNPLLDPSTIQTSSLTSLKTLRLGATDTMPSLMSFLAAPNLQALQLTDLDDSQLTVSFHHKFPKLQKLCITRLVDPKFNPFPLLQAFPTLSSLTLQKIEISKYEKLLEMRNPMHRRSKKSNPLCPMLKTLTVDYPIAKDGISVADTLFSLVIARAAIGYPLKTLRTDYVGMCFDLSSPLFSQDVARFRGVLDVEFHWDLLDDGGENRQWHDFQSALDADFRGDLGKSERGADDYYFEREDLWYRERCGRC
jgi:hypothetical protein